MSQKRRILSIDGGGIRGIYPATILAEIENQLPEPLYKYFDLIADTSTGGIIALGIGLGYKASEIVTFYEKYGPRIFKGSWPVKLFRHVFETKYAHEQLTIALKETFGERLIGESKTRLVIPSMNIQNGDVHIYKTCHREDFDRDYHRPVYEAALATSSALTYFPNYINSTSDILTDGGLWANNPILASLMDGIGILEWDKKNINVLSLGCIEKPFSKSLHKRKGIIGLLRSGIAEVFMAMQSKSALSSSYTLLGHGPVTRINDIGNFSLDCVKELPAMKALAEKRASKEIGKIMPIFFEEIVTEPFVPFKSV
ncbi:MAG: CBASS cGAMP-activated phospholipase [Pyrinomonadaceae bacterium]